MCVAAEQCRTHPHRCCFRSKRLFLSMLLDCRHAAHVITLATTSSFLGIPAAAVAALAKDTWDKSEAVCVYVC